MIYVTSSNTFGLFHSPEFFLPGVNRNLLLFQRLVSTNFNWEFISRYCKPKIFSSLTVKYLRLVSRHVNKSYFESIES